MNTLSETLHNLMCTTHHCITIKLLWKHILPMCLNKILHNTIIYIYIYSYIHSETVTLLHNTPPQTKSHIELNTIVTKHRCVVWSNEETIVQFSMINVYRLIHDFFTCVSIDSLSPLRAWNLNWWMKMIETDNNQ